MNTKQFQPILLILIVVIATLGMPRPAPLSVTLPEGHRAYEWEWTVKFENIKQSIAGKPSYSWREVLKQEIMDKLGKQVDEKGQPLHIIGEPQISVVDSSVRQFRDWSYLTVTAKAKTRFHGYFTEEPQGPSLVVITTSMVVALIIYKVAPLVIAGIIAIIVLDKLRQILVVIRDITTDYVEEKEYLVDDEGNLVLDDEGNPIVIRYYTSRTSNIGEISEWMPWIFNIILVVVIAFALIYLLPLFMGGKKRRK